MMEDWRCPLCEGCESDACFSRWVAKGHGQRAFAVVRCQRCGLFSLRPRPGPQVLPKLYPPDYEPYWQPLDEEASLWRRWMRHRHYAYRCQAVQRARPGGGWLLDIGCGTGGFAHQLSLKGAWRAACVDIHPGALDVARRQGVPAWCGDAATVCLPSASFDVVTMWEVIEHIPAPRQALCEAHRILKPGGRLLLSTPNALSWQARLWGEHWAGWEVPRHLQLFSLPTLRRMLQETGFEIVRRLSFPAERFCAVASARRWLNEQGDGAPWRVSRLVGVAGWAVWPALRLIDCTPWASSIVLEAARA